MDGLDRLFSCGVYVGIETSLEMIEAAKMIYLINTLDLRKKL
jgi:hypothetical protein